MDSPAGLATLGGSRPHLLSLVFVAAIKMEFQGPQGLVDSFRAEYGFGARVIPEVQFSFSFCSLRIPYFLLSTVVSNILFILVYLFIFVYLFLHTLYLLD